MPGKPSDKGVFGLSVNKMRSPWIPALTALLLGGAGWGLEYRLFHFDLDDRGLIRPGAASAVRGRNDLGFAGQALHAERLRLIHPRTHEQMEFFAPLPEHFKAALEKLRGANG